MPYANFINVPSGGFPAWWVLEVAGFAWSSFPAPNLRVPVPKSGTLNNLSVSIPTNTTNGVTTVQLLVNGLPVGTPITFIAEEVGLKKELFVVPVVDGESPDVVSFFVQNDGGAGALVLSCSSLFIPESD